MALTPKRRAFIEEYLKSFSATRAAIDAGYSEKTAYSIGHALLKDDEVAEAIAQRLQESAMTADEVLMRLAAQARGDVAEFLVDDGAGNVTITLEPYEDGRPRPTALIKKLTQKRTTRVQDDKEVEDTVTSIELYDAQAALTTIGRHHAMFTDRTVSANYDIDLSKLSDDQLTRVANGEDVVKVVLDGYINST